MAKGRVTDEDLASSLHSLGGLGGIASSGARRDSPFGSEFARKIAPEPTPEPRPVQHRGSKPPDHRPVREVVPPSPPAASTPPESKPQPPVRVAADPKPRAKEKPKTVEVASKIPARKLESFTEKVTIQMAPDMRDALNLTAAKLQRRKTDKSERITPNTLMRIAIRILLDEVDFETGGIANSEEDLLRIAREKLLGS